MPMSTVWREFLAGEGVGEGLTSVVGGGEGAGAEHFEFYSHHPRAEHVELFGGGGGEVDDAAGDEGAAVVDADDDRLAVSDVGHADAGTEGQGAVGGGEAGGVEGLAVGGFSAL